MNYDDLVLEIVNRVSDKLQNQELNGSAASRPGKARLLVLAREDGPLCQQFRSAPALLERYDVESSFSQQYAGDIREYSAVVLFNMDCGSLAKIASGIEDTPYTEAAVRAILLGKKLWLPKEAVEIYGYMMTAPQPYYEMMLKKLEFLQRSNVTICGYDELLPLLLELTSAPRPEPQPRAGCARIEKRVVTERDINAAYCGGAGSVSIPQRAIVTDMAKEYAANHGVEIIRG
ncbi:MAG: hypothetical protein Q4D58_02775 [Synergistaceae bacterium]|nr:hypothetical protein [Synergistaceae bacterium]